METNIKEMTFRDFALFMATEGYSGNTVVDHSVAIGLMLLNIPLFGTGFAMKHSKTKGLAHHLTHRMEWRNTYYGSIAEQTV